MSRLLWTRQSLCMLSHRKKEDTLKFEHRSDQNRYKSTRQLCSRALHKTVISKSKKKKSSIKLHLQSKTALSLQHIYISKHYLPPPPKVSSRHSITLTPYTSISSRPLHQPIPQPNPPHSSHPQPHSPHPPSPPPQHSVHTRPRVLVPQATVLARPCRHAQHD